MMEYRGLYILPKMSVEPKTFRRWYCDIYRPLGEGLARTDCYKHRSTSISIAKILVDHRRHEWRVSA